MLLLPTKCRSLALLFEGCEPRRQRNGYTTGDGITPDQVPGVEAIYRRMLEQLEEIFRQCPILYKYHCIRVEMQLVNWIPLK